MDLTNAEIISRHGVAVNHTRAYHAPAVRQERVTETSEAWPLTFRSVQSSGVTHT